MARGFELSEGKRAQVLLLHEMGFSQRKIACKLLVSRCAVRRCIDRYKTCTKSTAEVKQPKKLMVWGCFSGKSGRGAIWFMPPGSTINSGVYVGILKEKLLPFRQIHQVQYFQHDGAPCHMAACVSKWLASEHIPVIGPWPGSSPDLNPIEHLWSQMKRKVAVRNPTSVENLKEVIKSVWVTETALDACKALARSMPRRIVAVLAAKGHHTKY